MNQIKTMPFQKSLMVSSSVVQSTPNNSLSMRSATSISTTTANSTRLKTQTATLTSQSSANSYGNNKKLNKKIFSNCVNPITNSTDSLASTNNNLITSYSYRVPSSNHDSTLKKKAEITTNKPKGFLKKFKSKRSNAAQNKFETINYNITNNNNNNNVNTLNNQNEKKKLHLSRESLNDKDITRALLNEDLIDLDPESELDLTMSYNNTNIKTTATDTTATATTTTAFKNVEKSLVSNLIPQTILLSSPSSLSTTSSKSTASSSPQTHNIINHNTVSSTSSLSSTTSFNNCKSIVNKIQETHQININEKLQQQSSNGFQISNNLNTINNASTSNSTLNESQLSFNQSNIEISTATTMSLSASSTSTSSSTTNATTSPISHVNEDNRTPENEHDNDADIDDNSLSASNTQLESVVDVCQTRKTSGNETIISTKISKATVTTNPKTGQINIIETKSLLLSTIPLDNHVNSSITNNHTTNGTHLKTNNGKLKSKIYYDNLKSNFNTTDHLCNDLNGNLNSNYINTNTSHNINASNTADKVLNLAKYHSDDIFNSLHTMNYRNNRNTNDEIERCHTTCSQYDNITNDYQSNEYLTNLNYKQLSGTTDSAISNCEKINIEKPQISKLKTPTQSPTKSQFTFTSPYSSISISPPISSTLTCNKFNQTSDSNSPTFSSNSPNSTKSATSVATTSDNSTNSILIKSLPSSSIYGCCCCTCNYNCLIKQNKLNKNLKLIEIDDQLRLTFNALSIKQIILLKKYSYNKLNEIFHKHLSSVNLNKIKLTSNYDKTSRFYSFRSFNTHTSTANIAKEKRLYSTHNTNTNNCTTPTPIGNGSISITSAENVNKLAITAAEQQKPINLNNYRVFGLNINSYYQQTGYPLPTIIMHAMNIIETNSKDLVGIFRKPGVKTRIDEIHKLIDTKYTFRFLNSNNSMYNQYSLNGNIVDMNNNSDDPCTFVRYTINENDVDDSDCCDVDYNADENSDENTRNLNQIDLFDLADLIKQFFRELPECILTNKFSQIFLSIYSNEVPNEERFRAMQYAILLMPDENREALRILLNFLNNIAANKENNHMNSTNLATCFVPSIFNLNIMKISHNKENTILSSMFSPKRLRKQFYMIPDQKDMEEQRTAINCFADMIVKSKELFEVPDDLIERFIRKEDAKEQILDLSIILARNDSNYKFFVKKSFDDLLRESKDRAKGWTSKLTDNCIEIYEKKLNDSNNSDEDDDIPLKMYKCVFETDAIPLKTCEQILVNRQVWDKNVEDMEKLSNIDNETDIVRYTIKSMKPHLNRELIEFRSWKTDSDKGKYGFICTSVHSLSNLTPKIELQSLSSHSIRANCYCGHYLIEYLSHNKMRIVHLNRIDLKGKSLKWYTTIYPYILLQMMMQLKYCFKQNSINLKNQRRETNL